MARSRPIVLAAYNEPMVNIIATTLRPFLRAGDVIDLVSGNNGHELSVPTLNGWAQRLAPTLGTGIGFVGHTSGLEKADQLARTAMPAVTAVLLDYEPNFDPLFTWDLAATLAHFDRFAAACRAAGRHAVGYPTGRPLAEGGLQTYGWDYGEMATHLDDLFPQTQHWATRGRDVWTRVLGKLRDQLTRKGSPAAPFTAQLTIGEGGNAIDPDSAVQRYQEAIALGVARLYLWWAPPFADAVRDFLSRLDA